jgi:ATP-binding cassette subfamily C exporter for protease/lipase
VVLVTHRPGAVALADRLLLLADGVVQAEGPRDAVLAAIRAAASAQAAGSAPSSTSANAAQTAPPPAGV